MTMTDANEKTPVEQIAELPLDERAAAFADLERELRAKLDDQSD